MSGKGVLLGVVGGIAGFILTGGNPAGAVVGFALGMGVGMAMDATTADAPDTPGQGQINKMDIPTCNYGDPLPDFIGTTKITGNIIQSWGHRVEEITEQQSTPAGKAGGGGEGQTVVVGYKHYLSWLHAFAYGFEPASTLRTVLFDDKVVYYGTLTDDDVDGEETIQLGDPSGESLGAMTFYFGRNNQTANAKASAALDDPTLTSAYRGLVYAMFDDVMVGSYARMPTVKVIVSKHPVIASIGATPLEIVNTLDYNPAHAIWYLTEKHTGLSTSFLNAASFATAASYFKNTDFPGVGISMFINRQVTAETYIEAIISHVGASLVEIDGELNLGVLRNDVSESSMDTITDTESLAIPSLTIGSWEDTYNDVKISYSKVNHRVDINCGSIGQEYIDRGEIHDSYLTLRSIIHVSTNIYLINFGGLFKTFQVNPDGTLGSVLDTHTYSTPTNIGSLSLGMCVVSTNPVVTYIVIGGVTSLYASVVVTLSINNATGEIAEVDFVNTGLLYGGTTANGVVNMGSNIFAIATDGGIYTVEIQINGVITTLPSYISALANPGATYPQIYRVGNSPGNRNVLVSYTNRTDTPVVLDRNGYIKSYNIDTGGSITLLDIWDMGLGAGTSDLYRVDVVPEPYISADGTYSWPGIAFAYNRAHGAYLKVITVGLTAGIFDAVITDSWEVKPVQVGETYLSKIGGLGSTGKGLVLYYQYGATLASARITTFYVEYDGTMSGSAEDDAQTIGGDIWSQYMWGYTPLLINGSTGKYLLTYCKLAGTHNPWLQTVEITSYCDEYE